MLVRAESVCVARAKAHHEAEERGSVRGAPQAMRERCRRRRCVDHMAVGRIRRYYCFREAAWVGVLMFFTVVGHSDDIDADGAVGELILQCRAALGDREPQAGIMFAG